MTVNDACAKKIIKLIQAKKITQYRLEKDSGVTHGAMNRILMGKNNTITLTTLFKICLALDISPIEFLDDELFDFNKIEVD